MIFLKRTIFVSLSQPFSISAIFHLPRSTFLLVIYQRYLMVLDCTIFSDNVYHHLSFLAISHTFYISCSFLLFLVHFRSLNTFYLFCCPSVLGFIFSQTHSHTSQLNTTIRLYLRSSIHMHVLHEFLHEHYFPLYYLLGADTL